MRHWYVDREVEHSTRRCLRCGQPLAWVEQVGWVGTTPGDAYDICEADAYGNHLAGPLLS